MGVKTKGWTVGFGHITSGLSVLDISPYATPMVPYLYPFITLTYEY